MTFYFLMEGDLLTLQQCGSAIGALQQGFLQKRELRTSASHIFISLNEQRKIYVSVLSLNEKVASIVDEPNTLRNATF